MIATSVAVARQVSALEAEGSLMVVECHSTDGYATPWGRSTTGDMGTGQVWIHNPVVQYAGFSPLLREKGICD